MTLRDYRETQLLEMPQGKTGDWDYKIEELPNYNKSKNMITITRTGMVKSWTSIKEITLAKFENLILYKLNTDEIYMIGQWQFDNEKNEEVFIVISEGKLKKINLNVFDMKKCYQMYSIKTHGEEYRFKGLATTIYKYLIHELKYTIVSDETQYDGARKTYSRLSKDKNITSSIIDLYNKIFVNKDIEINTIDDSSIWSMNRKTLKHIRITLQEK